MKTWIAGLVFTAVIGSDGAHDASAQKQTPTCEGVKAMFLRNAAQNPPCDYAPPALVLAPRAISMVGLMCR